MKFNRLINWNLTWAVDGVSHLMLSIVVIIWLIIGHLYVLENLVAGSIGFIPGRFSELNTLTSSSVVNFSYWYSWYFSLAKCDSVVTHKYIGYGNLIPVFQDEPVELQMTRLYDGESVVTHRYVRTACYIQGNGKRRYEH